MKTKKQNAVQQYLTEAVSFGGEMMTRGEMIQELRKMANGNEQLVTAYLCGHERGRKARAEV